MENTQSRKNCVIFIGVALIIIGVFVLSSNYFYGKIDNAYAYMNGLLLESESEEIYEIPEEVDNLDATSSFPQEETKKDPAESYYIGSIEIPKVNVNRGFTTIDSPYNTISKNVQVIKGSTYPNVKNGNFILAAHSGNSYIAYFHDLYKLGKGDVAYVNFQNKKYTYKIVNIYEQQKTGKIAIYRDTSKTCLTLVTCTRNKKDKQTIYILELEDVKDI